MRTAQRIILLTVISLFIIGFSFAQDTSGTTPPPADPCAGVTCSASTTTCPDGFVASCSNSCSAGACSSCAPSCASHEAAPPQQTTPETCPTPPPQPQCKEGETTSAKYDDKRCLVGYECVSSSQERTCPLAPVPQCATTTYLKTSVSNGCDIYECAPLPTQPDICPPTTPPQCAPETYLQTQYDNNGCVNYICTELKPPEKRQNYICGNSICEPGEERFCQNDCIDAKPTCPAQITCFDQTTVNCYQGENGACKCDQCPISDAKLPQGCVQETDEKGFVRVKCENQRTCPEVPQDVRLKCVDGGGNPRFSKDPAGCEVFNCDFGKRGSLLSGQQQQCPTKEEIDNVFNKCGEFKVPGVIAFENGCNVARCAQKEEQTCGQPTESEIRKMKDGCSAEGSELIRDFDRTGCPIFRCNQRNNCAKDPPPEAFQRCAQNGGELIVRKDPNGCMAFANCVGRGDERNAYVERPADVPDTTELLSIAFRLESLRIDLDKLAKKTEDIAKYYESTGSDDKERFKRVSDMFEAAVGKVDEIREKLRDKVDSATINDMIEVKQDIKYIKDVMLKDILYLMLSKEAGDVKERSENDCGTDESCFGNALRVCKPITFYPEGDNGPKVTLKGLEGDSCIMYAIMEKFPNGQGPPGVQLPVDMTCKIKDYASGMRNPEEDIFPFCEGSMAEMIKKYGTDGPSEGPGGCRGDECDEFCSRPENREECQRFAEEHGINTQGRASGQDFNREQFSREGEKNFERGDNEFDNNYQGQQYYDQGYEEEPQYGGSQQYGGPGPQYGGQPYLGGQPYGQPQNNFRPQSVSQSQPAACIGCFDNGVCDANECPECMDCSARPVPQSTAIEPITQSAEKPQ